MDLPGPSACVGRGPRIGGPGRRTGGDRHRSVWAQSRRLRWSGVGLRLAPGSCSESHGNSGLGQQGGAARGSEGFQACRKRRAALFPARGYAVLPPIAPSFHGFRRSGTTSSSEHLQISRDSEGATPKGRRGKSAWRVARRESSDGVLGRSKEWISASFRQFPG